ncbi:YesL family protein [Jeotgalibaca ciconiae]|uniref:DUF624 domain-containing protein n=1 Tax=Jeotgalibaca ciconiae TaxID=2496265 RepID=A0A3Q9BJ34_9LACT|nr:YesL family protein [Jeotgalibaca ciconiae]AZP03540.1 DUF624 domain-containing protein [Jeotgalibaca ciconiae]
MGEEQKQEFGSGKLYKITQNIYWFFGINIIFLLSNSLFFIFILFLEKSFSNISLYLLSIIPSGPALAAIIGSTFKIIEIDDFSTPIKDFVTYYKKNFFDSLKIWIPFLFILLILFTDVFYFYESGSSLGFFFFLFLTILVILYMIPTFMINIKFKFKIKDLLKLGAFYSLTKIKITFGNLATLFTLFVLVFYISELILLFICSLLVYFLVNYNYSIIKEIREKYTLG